VIDSGFRVKEPETLQAIVCKAVGCRQVLGGTDGRCLYMATCHFKRSVTIHCRACGQANVWKPDPEPKGNHRS